MKKFTDKINESSEFVARTLNSMSESSLKERLEYLRLEMKEISDEIQSISSILKGRSDESFKVMMKSYPKGIFELNSDQLSNIFINDDIFNTTYQYNIRRRYWEQVSGFYPSGTKDGKASFSLCLSRMENDITGEFEIPKNIEKSFKLLIDNLTDSKGSLNIDILGHYDDHSYNKMLIVQNDELLWYYYKGSTPKRYPISELNKVLRIIYDEDKSYDENDENNW